MVREGYLLGVATSVSEFLPGQRTWILYSATLPEDVEYTRTEYETERGTEELIELSPTFWYNQRLKATVHARDSIWLETNTDGEWGGLLLPWLVRGIDNGSTFEGPARCLIATDPIVLVPLTSADWQFERPNLVGADGLLYRRYGILLAGDSALQFTANRLHVFEAPSPQDSGGPAPSRTIDLVPPRTIEQVLHSPNLWAQSDP